MALSKRALVRWLLAHGFTEVPRRASSHRRFRHTRTTLTVADHGRPELSSKHVGMLLRELERAGFVSRSDANSGSSGRRFRTQVPGRLDRVLPGLRGPGRPRGVGYALVVWIVTAMLLFGLGRLIWAVLRWAFRS